jgi:hypothetical protein
MTEINWDEYKFYKKTRFLKSETQDNFDILIDFLKSNYKMTAAQEIFETIEADEIGQMMLSKRDLSEIELFEKYLYKNIKFDE